jgi:hypothetical protein
VSDDEKPTPPVLPQDITEIREKRTGPRTLGRERVDTCDCGGTIYEETIATGRTMLAIWYYDDWDSDVYRLSNGCRHVRSHPNVGAPLGGVVA